MAGKDPAHTASLPQGPAPPLIRRWHAKSGDPKSSFTNWPVVSQRGVFARSAGGALAVDANTGERFWWRDFGSAEQSSPATDEKNLYLPLGNHQIIALDQGTGESKWMFSHSSGAALGASPTISDGLLFFGLPKARMVLAVRADTGTIAWETAMQLEPDSVPAVAAGVVVLSADDPNSNGVQVSAFDAASGQPRWKLDQMESTSSISIADGIVFFGGGDRKAYAVELETGNKKWASPTRDKFDPWTMPSVAFGDVFLADRVGNVYRFDGDTGKRKWIFTDTTGTMDQSFPVIAGRTLFIGSGAGWLYALNTESGELLWKDRVRGIVLSGAADAERFYFGVKLGPDEGLHAYEHDPNGELEGGRSVQDLQSLIGGVLLFLLVFGGLLLYARRRRRLNRPS
jgi:outer membrane protein assembly factor BamB